jgi:ATP-dependent DNA helicase RecQ
MGVDGTEAAQKALSAIYRTGQRFGVGHIVDVLMGAASERIRSLGHDRLSVHGIGKELGRDGWRSVLRQLAAQGLVEVDVAGHGGLRLGEGCREVLRGERRVTLRQDPAAGPKPRGTARAAMDELPPEVAARFAVLRAWRLAAARAQGVPPYVVFHDATLLAVAQAPPATLAELARLPGIGAAKLERYGQAILAALAAA